jgi:hypothetical protein
MMLCLVGLTNSGFATCLEDSDGDSVPDPYDNCVLVENDQTDTDRDGLGNACDPDFDQDGIVLGNDVVRLFAGFGSRDPLLDLDGDGIVLGSDFVALTDYFGGSPGPSGLACASGPAGGVAPCEVTSYFEIASTTPSVELRPHRSVPAPGGLSSDDTLFVFPSPAYEMLSTAYPIDYAASLVYDPTTAATPMTVGEGTIISRWILHAESSSGAGVSIPGGTGVTFDASEEVLGANVIADPLSSLAFDGGDLFEIDGQTVSVTVPTVGIQLEVVTACAPPTGVTMSLDGASTSIGAPASFPAGATIEAGDLLTVGDPGAPGPNPEQSVLPISLPGEMVDQRLLMPGVLVPVDVDALSFGRDRGRILWFSVDEQAVGRATVLKPDVRSEGASGNGEAAADVFEWAGVLPGTPTGMAGNLALLDGDGFAPFGGDGLGLVEISLPDGTYVGDDVDAFDGDTIGRDLDGQVYFSLDSASASALGGSGADIFVYRFLSSFGENPGGGMGQPIPRSLLGLDPGDDIDALALHKVDPALPFDPAVDRIHFSLRRGSPTIGMIDCRFGLPIEPGDVLTIPCPGASTPAIGVRAEDLGLRTIRSGAPEADELDALDRLPDARLGGGGDDPSIL